MTEGSLVVFIILAALVCRGSSLNGKFWHVTDFHYDHRQSCNNGGSQLGGLEDYGCGSPWKVVNDVIEAMKEHEPDVDFLLWTGDSVACINDTNLSVDIIIDVLQNITQALTKAFPNKTVYATLGNRDSWPTNQFSVTLNEIYNRIATMWTRWIKDPEQLNNFRKGGYYTATPAKGLRIIALNTNLYYTSNNETRNISDPAGQLAWMESVLWNATRGKEKVLITAHIGPGVYPPKPTVWFQDEFVQRFNDIIEWFANIIVGMHFGHDHHDGFKFFLSRKDVARVPMFLAPAVTPCRYTLEDGSFGPPHDPAVRLVRYDTSTFRHLDLEQYHLDLPFSSKTGVAKFTLLYRFTEHYNVTDLTAGSLEALVERMERGSESDKLLDDYIRFSEAGAKQTDIRWCDTTCRYQFLCGFRYHTLTEFNRCVSMYKHSQISINGDPPMHYSATVGLFALIMVGIIMVM